MVGAYKSYCREQGFDEQAPSLLSVGGYCLRYTTRVGSTKTIDAVLTSIRRDCLTTGIPYLPASEVALLGDLVKELKFNDTTEVRRVRPLTRILLDAIYSQGTDGLGKKRMALVMMTLAHDGMLRSGETCSGLRGLDLQWNRKRTSVSVHLLRTKGNRTGGGQVVTMLDYGRESGCALLRAWCDDMNIREGSTSYVFPRWDERKQAFDRKRFASTDQFRRYIKKAVESVGMPPSEYSGHSCRAGGATDAFNAGVPYATVKKFGRWKSDTVLLYYRDEDEVAYHISNAFRSRRPGRDRKAPRVPNDGSEKIDRHIPRRRQYRK
jgi:hypothetical protein